MRHFSSHPPFRQGFGRPRTRLRLALLAFGLFLAPGRTSADLAAPPGYNVRLVREGEKGQRFWRGGAPRQDTLKALASAARKRSVPLTLVDLRTPPTSDDRSGKEGRLSPEREAALAKELGLDYVPVSAMDRELVGKVRQALDRGDVYMHCMYGVNRTGFATARYARATGAHPDATGLGKRDWDQGDRFQKRLQR
jgi:hypothetical protein